LLVFQVKAAYQGEEKMRQSLIACKHRRWLRTIWGLGILFVVLAWGWERSEGVFTDSSFLHFACGLNRKVNAMGVLENLKGGVREKGNEWMELSWFSLKPWQHTKTIMKLV
jgi:hypothetical protein